MAYTDWAKIEARSQKSRRNLIGNVGAYEGSQRAKRRHRNRKSGVKRWNKEGTTRVSADLLVEAAKKLTPGVNLTATSVETSSVRIW